MPPFLQPLLNFEEITWTFRANETPAPLDTRFWLGAESGETGFTLAGSSATQLLFADGEGRTAVISGSFTDSATPAEQTFQTISFRQGGTEVFSGDLGQTVGLTAQIDGLYDDIIGMIDGAGGTRFKGAKGIQIFEGFATDDTYRGRNGNDAFEGEAGEDRAFGENGRDYLGGGADDDRLFGGKSHDVIVGGAGIDIVEGGTDADLFVFEPNDERTIIRDWAAEDFLLFTGIADSATPWFSAVSELVPGASTLADLSPADLKTLGIQMRENAQGNTLVKWGDAVMVIRDTGLDEIPTASLFSTGAGTAEAIGQMNDETGLGFITWGEATGV